MAEANNPQVEGVKIKQQELNHNKNNIGSEEKDSKNDV